MRSVLGRAVRAAGHRGVLGAETAMKPCADFPGHPDVVVLDIGLPDADGRDVCRALRAGGLGASVLFLTALDGVHNKIAGFESGGDDYLTKPFEPPSHRTDLGAGRRRPGVGPRAPEHSSSTRPRTPSVMARSSSR